MVERRRVVIVIAVLALEEPEGEWRRLRTRLSTRHVWYGVHGGQNLDRSSFLVLSRMVRYIQHQRHPERRKAVEKAVLSGMDLIRRCWALDVIVRARRQNDWLLARGWNAGGWLAALW